MEFFCDPAVQAQMKRLLVLYVLEHPTVGYRQGMHEIAAPLLWVLSLNARQPSSSSEAHPLDVLLDKQYVWLPCCDCCRIAGGGMLV